MFYCFEFTKNDAIESIHSKFGNTFAFINKKGEVYLYHKNIEEFCGKLDQQLFENKKITKVVSGAEHVLFLTSDSCVFSLGYIGSGQLGHGRNTQVFSCGDSTYGADAQPLYFNKIVNEFQLVYNDRLVKELLIGYFYGAFKTVEDKYQIFGLNNCCQFSDNFPKQRLKEVTDLQLKNNLQNDIDQLECGGYGTIIVTKNGKIYYRKIFRCLLRI
ncbi:hypothetical protein ABK040_004008 [Willaertia magna]